MINKIFHYKMPTQVYFGHGSIAQLKKVAGTGKKILLVTGRSFLKKTGWLKKVKNILKGNKIKEFSGIYENPDLRLIETGIMVARIFKPDLIVAIGGGSVLDSAKAISLLARNKGCILSFLDKKLVIKKPGITVIVVPTTAGSSSEITPYSVITVKERKIKITLAHEYLYPAAAIIDPEILSSLSRRQIANSGIDVLCHAIESYWSIANNPVSDIFALESIKLVFSSLKEFYLKPFSKKAAVRMSLASLFAGFAFSNTGTTVCHSISYPLTAIFDIPHGQACSVTLPEALIYNYGSVPERINDICKVIGASDPEKAAKKIRELMLNIGLKIKLRGLGIKRDDFGVIIEKSFTPEKMKNNPKKISRHEMAGILSNCY